MIDIIIFIAGKVFRKLQKLDLTTFASFCDFIGQNSNCIISPIGHNAFPISISSIWVFYTHFNGNLFLAIRFLNNIYNIFCISIPQKTIDGEEIFISLFIKFKTHRVLFGVNKANRNFGLVMRSDTIISPSCKLYNNRNIIDRRSSTFQVIKRDRSGMCIFSFCKCFNMYF